MNGHHRDGDGCDMSQNDRDQLRDSHRTPFVRLPVRTPATIPARAMEDGCGTFCAARLHSGFSRATAEKTHECPRDRRFIAIGVSSLAAV
jgi:hypothetical protein